MNSKEGNRGKYRDPSKRELERSQRVVGRLVSDIGPTKASLLHGIVNDKLVKIAENEGSSPTASRSTRGIRSSDISLLKNLLADTQGLDPLEKAVTEDALNQKELDIKRRESTLKKTARWSAVGVVGVAATGLAAWGLVNAFQNRSAEVEEEYKEYIAAHALPVDTISAPSHLGWRVSVPDEHTLFKPNTPKSQTITVQAEDPLHFKKDNQILNSGIVIDEYPYSSHENSALELKVPLQDPDDIPLSAIAPAFDNLNKTPHETWTVPQTDTSLKKDLILGLTDNNGETTYVEVKESPAKSEGGGQSFVVVTKEKLSN